jgi:hypothetical protein
MENSSGMPLINMNMMSDPIGNMGYQESNSILFAYWVLAKGSLAYLGALL